MKFSIPTDIDKRPIAVIGAGTLGRRIALMMSSQGGEVRLYDKVQHSREEGVKFVEETLPLILPSIPNSGAAKVAGTADPRRLIARGSFSNRPFSLALPRFDGRQGASKASDVDCAPCQSPSNR
jgi:lactate dehydrogenase-like 2-hydroxyacid dehydrogenase